MTNSLHRCALALCLVATAAVGCAPEPAELDPADAAATEAAETGDTAEATLEPADTAMAATAVAEETADAADDDNVLTIITHDSFAVSDEVMATFDAEHDFEVRFLEGGDTGEMVNRVILTQDNPIADVVYGVDNTFLSRLLAEDVLISYESPRLASIPDRFELDPEHRALPVDYGDVCPNYDKAALDEAGVEPPTSLEDLADPDYAGMLTVENPATSSPGLAFLLATIGHFGEDGYLDYWRDLVENDVQVVNDWETAYNQSFTRAGGDRPIVISYGSSPPFEVLYADEELDEAPTGAVTADSCFRQIEFVGIIDGTEMEAEAQAWIDFMLSPTFQEDIPLQMFVFPVHEDAELDPVFTEHMQVPEETADVSPEAIDANREDWINAWTDVVLR